MRSSSHMEKEDSRYQSRKEDVAGIPATGPAFAAGICPRMGNIWWRAHPARLATAVSKAVTSLWCCAQDQVSWMSVCIPGKGRGLTIKPFPHLACFGPLYIVDAAWGLVRTSRPWRRRALLKLAEVYIGPFSTVTLCKEASLAPSSSCGKDPIA